METEEYTFCHDLDQPTKETSSFISGKEDRLTMDDLMEKLMQGWTWKYALLLLSLALLWLASPSHTYLTMFAGINPTTNDTWSCASQKCEDLIKENPALSEKYPCEITDENGTALQKEDVVWDLDHTSFSVEFDLYCGDADRLAKKTLISSIFFVGALTGLILGGYLFDHLGRKKTATFGYLILNTSVFCGLLCHNYNFLLVIRYFQGVGSFLFSTGMVILSFELSPTRLRNYICGILSVFWACGYPLAAGLFYFIPDWNFKYLGASVVVALLGAPVFTSIESPRYYLINNDFESAKKSLKALESLTTSDLELDKIDLTNLLSVSDKLRQQTLKQQLMDLKNHPVLLRETVFQMFIWLCEAMFFYGFNFGWGAIFPNIYHGYMFGGLGELLAAIFVVPGIEYLGRRRAMMLGYLGAGFFYLLAIPDVELGGEWTLENISCLIGLVFVSACFSGIYLWSGELAPTSHRGLVFCACSSVARIGSFIGPYIFNNLAPVTHKAVPLGLLAFLTLLCALGSFLLVETGDKKICLTGEDVVVRRKKFFSYRI